MSLVKNTVAAGLVTAAFASLPSESFAASIDIFVESNDNRGGAATSGDIVGTNVPTVVTGSQSIGLAGRIVRAIDDWTFTSQTAFNVSFVDLILGPADDGNAFLDGSPTNPATAPNSDLREVEISLLGTSFSQKYFPSDVNSETLIFGNVTAGTYTLRIDGLVPSAAGNGEGATYDIQISAVPLPAAGWMLLAGLGGLVATRRRKKT